MEEDLYFIDTRNATTDHRTGGSSSGGRRPVQSVRVPYQQAQTYYAQPQQYLPPYAQPQVALPASTLLGRVTTGQIIDLVAQIFAALMPLPAAPTATADTHTDVGNLMLYQGALAQYAKRDEQVRTLGNLVTKLVG
ncbi:MAG: hypothetical protein ABJA80_05730 [bacterium]